MSAATTGLSKAKFEISAVSGQVVTEEIWVENTDTIEQKYEFRIDDKQFAENVSIVPHTFLLAPDKFQKVVIRFRAPEKSEKKYLSLIAFDNNNPSNLRIANGMKIPVQFNVAQAQVKGESTMLLNQKNDTINWMHALVWIVDAVLLVVFVYYRRKRKLRLSHSINYESFI